MNYKELEPRIGETIDLVRLTGTIDNIPCYLENAAYEAYKLGIKNNLDFVAVKNIGTVAFDPWFTKSSEEINKSASRAFSKYVTGRGFVATRSSEKDAFIIDVKATQEKNQISLTR